jgi:adenine-specific DNA glycosylase
MDLGATICTAARPACLVCPLLAECGGPPASAAPSKAAAEQFHASRRFVRGRIVQLLRELPADESVALEELAQRVGGRPDLVQQLASDGLVRIDAAERVRLAD